MPRINFLPKNEDSIELPQATGCWESIHNIIGKLSDGIEISLDAEAEALTAIPTIWARPMLFAGALYDNSHPLHKEIKNEWRGLLGLLCFRDIFHWEMTIDAINFANQANLSVFEETLRIMSPEDEKNQWNSFSMINIENTLIGASNPLCLFYTPADYAIPNCRPQIPWIDNGKLTDPTLYLANQSSANSLSLIALEKWLEQLIKELSTYRFYNNDIYGKIHRTLSTWHDEVIQIIKNLNLSQTISQVKFTTSLIMNEMPYRLASFGITYHQPSISDFFLKCKLTNPAPIVFIKSLWDEFGQKIINNILTSDVQNLDIPEQPFIPVKHIINIQDEYDGFIVHPEFLFTDKIYKMDLHNENILATSHSYTMPFRQEILELFSSDELVNMVEFREKNRGLEVTIHLTLIDSKNREKQVPVQHYYSKSKIIECDFTPPISLWPNFIATDWQHYYLVYDMQATPDMICVPIASTTTNEYMGKDSKILWKLNSFPDALQCKNKKKEALGLILLRKPVQYNHGENKWKVSIDFGTSNTFVHTNDTLREFKLADRCYHITNADSDLLDPFICTAFFPNQDINGSFASQMMRINPVERPVALKDGLIIFAEYFRYQDILPDITLIENLKWSRRPEDLNFIQAFLNQLIMMVSAEARANNIREISLFYSYPSAFSRNKITQLRGFWNAIVNAANGFGLQLHIQEDLPESICTMKFFRTRGLLPNNQSRPQIVIDIGGGTTDVAIWMAGKIKLHTSLLIAGNIIADYAEENMKFREKMAQYTGINIDKDVFDKYPKAMMNKLLRLYMGKIFENIQPDLFCEEIQTMRSAIFMMAGGIFFYLGLLVKYLKEHHNVTVNGYDFFLAGNGSKLLHLCLSDGSTEPLIAMFEAALGSHFDDTQIVLPNFTQDKVEVGRGLLDDNYTPPREDLAPTMIAGEEGFSDGTEVLPWYVDLNSDPQYLQHVHAPQDFPILTQFIDAYNTQATNMNIPQLEHNFNRVGEHINQDIADFYNVMKDNLVAQPFFILGLRALLHEQVIKGGTNV